MLANNPAPLAPPFICPLCQSPLQLTAKTWQCDGSQNPKLTADGTPKQHNFDVARQGYVNLLPVQQKKSKAPGDSEDSINARQRFLAAGHYDNLQSLICEQVAQLSYVKLSKATASDDNQSSEAVKGKEVNNKFKNWLDIGCGEGYYTLAMTQKAAIDNMIAVDISKPAVMTLAKAGKASQQLWCQAFNKEASAKNATDGADSREEGGSHTSVIYPLVASVVNLPIEPESVDGISSIFSPILPEVFASTLKSEGWLVIAKPDVGHLESVREALFDSVREHDSDKFLHQLEPYFVQHEVHYCQQSLSLNRAALEDLLTMTPYAYRAQPAKRETLLASTNDADFTTEARFVVYVLRKR